MPVLDGLHRSRRARHDLSLEPAGTPGHHWLKKMTEYIDA